MCLWVCKRLQFTSMVINHYNSRLWVCKRLEFSISWESGKEFLFSLRVSFQVILKLCLHLSSPRLRKLPNTRLGTEGTHGTPPGTWTSKTLWCPSCHCLPRRCHGFLCVTGNIFSVVTASLFLFVSSLLGLLLHILKSRHWSSLERTCFLEFSRTWEGIPWGHLRQSVQNALQRRSAEQVCVSHKSYLLLGKTFGFETQFLGRKWIDFFGPELRGIL